MTYHLTGGLAPHRFVEAVQPLGADQGNVP
jgi:hypothetical protein